MLEDLLLEAAKVSPSVLAGWSATAWWSGCAAWTCCPSRREDDAPDKRVELNAEQRRRWPRWRPGFGAYLLYGITGSGKTEVYLELAERTLAAGRRVLWLVPEIGLTPRLLSRLEARFPGQVAVGHAGLNASEKQADVIAPAAGRRAACSWGCATRCWRPCGTSA